VSESVIYLSRRNLEALLSKLDRRKDGEQTHCTIIKNQQPDPQAPFRQSMKACRVIALEDEEFYGGQNRPAGEMHPSEEAKISKPSTGTAIMGVM
jgi:hypothetical protein